jgi:hypothetical protein
VTNSARFAMVLAPEDRMALQRLADHERLSAAATLRRLIWQALAEKDADGIKPEPQRKARTAEV